MRNRLLGILVIFVNDCCAQPQDAFFAFYDYSPGNQSIKLFDKDEIKARKIRAAFRIRHPIAWKSEDWSKPAPLQETCPCTYDDTFAIFKFDVEGRLSEFTYIYSPDSKIFHQYDSTGRRKDISWKPDTSQYREIVNRFKVGKDSVIQRVIFHKFKNGLDTAYVKMERFDSRGYLIEVKSTSNKRNNPEFFDNDTGAYDFHFFQDFDDQGRLIYYTRDKQNQYQRVSYPAFGKLVETYDAKTNTVASSEAIIFRQVGKIEPALLITSNHNTAVLTYLEKGSKLFKLISKIGFSEFPHIEYEEIVYSYRE